MEVSGSVPVCCTTFRAATGWATDSEGWCWLIGIDEDQPDKFSIGVSLPPMAFCPWCGKRLGPATPADDAAASAS